MALHVAPGYDAEGLEPLIATHPYMDYRHYRTIPPKAQCRILSSEIERAAEHGQLLTLRDEHRVVGLATLSPLPWDSNIFGLSMARIGPLIAASSPGPRAKILARLLEELVDMARSTGIRHLSTRVDCADIETIHGLEHMGFRQMECLVTYVFRPSRDIPPPIKILYHVRPYAPADREALLHIVERMYAHHQSRFSVDPSLPQAGVDRFYLEWTKNACSGEMADHVLVAERQGRPIGFLTYKLNVPVSQCTGIRVAGQGLSASLPEGTGAYVALMKTGLELVRGEYDFVEADAPLHHFVVIRTWQRLGFHPARAKYAFHRELT